MDQHLPPTPDCNVGGEFDFQKNLGQSIPPTLQSGVAGICHTNQNPKTILKFPLGLDRFSASGLLAILMGSTVVLGGRLSQQFAKQGYDKMCLRVQRSISKRL